MPLVFSERERQLLSNEIMVQAPIGLTPNQLRAIRRDMDKRVRGLPGDVLMALDALRLHADQGNRVAKWLFNREVERLGLTTTFTSYRRS